MTRPSKAYMWVYNVRKLHRPATATYVEHFVSRYCRCDLIMQLYNICDSAMFCALRDQLASLDRHAQLPRCFSAAAALLVTGS